MPYIPLKSADVSVERVAAILLCKQEEHLEHGLRNVGPLSTAPLRCISKDRTHHYYTVRTSEPTTNKVYCTPRDPHTASLQR
jgi:hypothetical protein